jgi:hypothetical protein
MQVSLFSSLFLYRHTLNAYLNFEKFIFSNTVPLFPVAVCAQRNTTAFKRGQSDPLYYTASKRFCNFAPEKKPPSHLQSFFD